MVVILSISQNINCISDSAFAPTEEEGLFPNPIACGTDVHKVPYCYESVKHFNLKDVTKECCIVLVGIPEDCFAILFPMRFTYRMALTATCKLLGITKL
ncbi:hypothetical protein Bca52824_047614 [Brassica carinata]|uniref:Prolamin-like domain-containing protein n=1 Tax=Brassica carinata TaxID=52824 RepID=A0A8X7RJK4_BRACI|nr:hypothetical protein Bca52824_047614 [Brassica carinata]